MNRPNNSSTAGKWLLILFAAILLIAFFIPWVAWDAKKITGADMAQGNFFRISEAEYGLANPFPTFDFVTVFTWLIPVSAVITLLLAFLNKKALIPSLIAGIVALSLLTNYYLFTNVLGDLGVNHSLEIGFYITILGAAGIILANPSRGVRDWLVKLVALVAGPAIMYFGFVATSSYLENEKHEDTANTASAYTVTALDLIREFQANDSAANAKYRDQVITVSGSISSVELPNDSTVNIKFTDTTGSYAIFPFYGEAAADAKKLKEGEMTSVKAICSGGVLSEILGIHSITFERTILNKQ